MYGSAGESVTSASSSDVTHIGVTVMLAAREVAWALDWDPRDAVDSHMGDCLLSTTTSRNGTSGKNGTFRKNGTLHLYGVTRMSFGRTILSSVELRHKPDS